MSELPMALEVLEIAVQRAEKGLAWLRESGPSHGLNIDLVDLDKLRLASGCNCVLGQLGRHYEDFSRVAKRLRGAGVFSENDLSWLSDHGFERKWLELRPTYADLTLAWRQVLTADRAVRTHGEEDA